MSTVRASRHVGAMSLRVTMTGQEARRTHALRDAAEEQVRQSRTPMGPHDDEIDVPVPGDLDDLVGRHPHLSEGLNRHVSRLGAVPGTLCNC